MPADSAAEGPTPGYAVIFISQRSENDTGYAEALERIGKLGRAEPGFVSLDSVRGPDGKGITVVLYENAEAVERWRVNTEHMKVKAEGRRSWYSDYRIYYTKVERSHGWSRGGDKARAADRP